MRTISECSKRLRALRLATIFGEPDSAWVLVGGGGRPMVKETREQKEDARDLLLRDMRGLRAHWRRSTRAYGLTYFASRMLLIVFSSIIAGADSLLGSPLAGAASWTPSLAILVAILVAVDTWLKPQQRWRGFMESRDRLGYLINQTEDGLELDKSRSDFLKLQSEHRRLNVY